MRGVSIRRAAAALVLVSLLGSDAAFAAGKFDPPVLGRRFRHFIGRVLDLLGVPPG